MISEDPLVHPWLSAPVAILAVFAALALTYKRARTAQGA
jgi:hypothetical protein